MDHLEKWAATDGGNLSEASTNASLTAGVVFGRLAVSRSFVGLLDPVKKGSKILVKQGCHAVAPIRRHGEHEAEKFVLRGLKQLGLVDEAGCLSPSRKEDPRKVALSSMVKAHTSFGNELLAVRLEMGHNRSVSSLIRQGSDADKIKKLCAKLVAMLPCED